MYSEDMFKEGIPLTSRKFHRILDFYLFHCPVDGTSARATTFEQQGWKGTLFSTLKREMLARASASLKSNYYPCTKAELEEKYVVVESLNSTDEYCVFLKHDSNRVMESLYSAIRNALAHGSFLMKKRRGTNMYFFANYDGYLKAVIQLKEETLLNWISLFQSNPEDVKRSID